MRISLAWLREYVDVVLPPQEMADRLTLAGLEVSGVEVLGGEWEKVQVGQVVDVQPHPNADRLRLVTVALGDSSPTVVCGAPNVAVGDKIAFASVGANLMDTHTGKLAALKPARIRGVLSEGMVCSEKELGMSENHEGILVLPGEAPVGKLLSEYLGDTIFDVEVTPNRPDCLSVVGIAREVAALTGQVLRIPGPTYPEGSTRVETAASVEIKDPELCSRYCASVILDINIGPSPDWMRRRLKAAGMRPINNVVDVTNYVMLEYGQPLHAFDYARINDQKIIVRRARQGEEMVSLDGAKRILNPEMLLICDARGPVAIAGVMGGANSEVSDSSLGVLLESANFNQASIRHTSAALGLRSEASLRFEKGLPAELCLPALRRATQLIIETAGGRAASGVIDVYPGEKERQPIFLGGGEVKRLLGIDVPLEHSRRIFDLLGISVQDGDSTGMRVTVPYWRTDITQSADLVEEVARITGYDKVPSTVIAAPIPAYEPSPALEMREKLRDTLAACGMQEIITYSLTNIDSLKKAAPDLSLPGPAPVRLANPMSQEQEYLRTSLRPGVLSTVAQNQRYQDSVKVFEIGKAYLPRQGDLPQEVETLCCALAGTRQSLSWRVPEASVDFFDAKGLLEAALGRLRVDATFKSGQDVSLMPGRTAGVWVGEQQVGVLGEVHAKVLDHFDARSPLYLIELDLNQLLSLVPATVEYHALPRFPASIRDIALVVDAGVQYRDIADVMKEFSLLSRAVLFDVYEGEQVPRGKKSLAFRLFYQSSAHTLTDDEVNRVQQRMLDALKTGLGATLRT